MANNTNYDLSKMRNPRHKRLAKEHIALYNLCSKSAVISYEILGDAKPVPSTYLIHYKLKSIVSLDNEFYPIYGNLHTIQVTLTKNYPVEPARCYAKTPIWHPNIKSEGKHQGRICSNTKEFGKLFSLDMLALRIGEMLQYKNYHALNTPPYPEDEEVARWVREFAEPQDIVNYDKGIVVDDTVLLNPKKGDSDPPPDSPADLIVPEDEPKEPPKSGIRIKKSRPADTGHIKFKKKDQNSD